MAEFKDVPRYDQALIGLGVLALIVSFFPYYGVKVNAAGLHASATVNAWHGWAFFGIVLVFLSTASVAIEDFSRDPLPRLQVTWTFIVAAMSVLGVICVFLRSVTLPSGGTLGLTYGVRFGGVLLIIVCAAHAAVAVVKLLRSGEPMPWANR
jgi:hypothetical protein